MPLEYGIFFHMPEDEYRALPALNATGLKHLRASPLDFWVRSPFNPNLADVLAEEGSSEAKELGSAFDVRIISGKEAFAAQYAEEIDPYEGVLRTLEELKAECRTCELAVSGNKDVLIERLLTHDGGYAAKIWDRILADYKAQHNGKTFLSAKWMQKIEIAARMIEADPVLSKAFTGGMPQVTIVWRDEVIGVDCKARLDYLKARAIVDLKTLQNVRGLPIAQAVNREIANRRYHIQAAFYLEAASYAARFVKEGLCDGVSPDYDPFTKAVAADAPKTFLWVFQVKGVAPVAVGRTLPEQSTLLQVAQAEIGALKQTYRDCMEHYGPDVPWVAPTAVEALQDDDIPGWMLT